MRYRFLETIREYGLEKLRESGEEAALRQRHLDWFLAFAEEGERGLWSDEQASWLDRLETDHDNLRAALDWSVTALSGLGSRVSEDQTPTRNTATARCPVDTV